MSRGCAFAIYLHLRVKNSQHTLLAEALQPARQQSGGSFEISIVSSALPPHPPLSLGLFLRSFSFLYARTQHRREREGGKVARSLQDGACLVPGRFSREKTVGTASVLVTRNIPPQCQSYVTHFETYQHARRQVRARTRTPVKIGLEK